MGRATVPSGVHRNHEAVELRDGDPKRYKGKGTTKAVENVNKKIAPALVGMDVLDQVGIDSLLLWNWMRPKINQSSAPMRQPAYPWPWQDRR